ncbi:MAG: hypothetical protein AAF620_16020 [Bacteroidota bacterium]
MKSLQLFLLLAISAFLQNCQQSDEPIEPVKPDFIVSNIDPSLNNELMEVLSATVYGEEIENGRVMSSAIGDIDLNEAVSAENLGLGIIRYTFRLETNEPYVFKNLILRKNQEDRFSGYIITYYPDLEWLAQNEGELEMISFTGNVLFSSLQEKPIYWVVVNYGKGTVYSPKTGSDEGGRVDCDRGSSSGGGSGPDAAGFGDSWVPTGGGSFDYAADLPSGGGSGG